MVGESADLKKKVLLTVNTAWNVVTFRAGLIRALISTGYEVVAVAPSDRHVNRVTALGCAYRDIGIDNGRTNPIRDATLLLRYFRLIRQERPSVVLTFTAKPNIYAALAAHMLGVPVIVNVAGLGSAFQGATWLKFAITTLYRIALRGSKYVFFQNNADMELFVSSGLVTADKAKTLPGSGIDPEVFAPLPTPPREGRPFRFLLSARLLWDKGVGEYVEAGRLLRANGRNVEIRLVGILEIKNPSAIPAGQLAAWVDEGVLNYIGEVDDVRPSIADVDCVVLPSSYPEGTPRSLIEAASMGKPIITTDSPGCRDVVIEGVTGYLVPSKNTVALAAAMQRMAELPKASLDNMAVSARAHAVERFNERIIIEAYKAAIAAYSK